MAAPSTYTLEEIESLTGFEKRTVAYYVQQGLLPKVGRRGAKTRYPQLFIDRLKFIKMVREQQDRGEIGGLTLAEIREIFERAPAEIVADVVAGREPMEAVDVRVDPDVDPELVGSGSAGHALRRPQRDPHNGEDLEAAPQPFQASEAPSDVIEVDMSFADQQPTPDPVPTAKESEPAPAPERAEPRLKGLSDTRSMREVQGLQSKPNPPPNDAPEAANADGDEEAAENGYPPVNELDRLGWSLARLQKVLTDAPRRKRGNTESWHRARITPELTISARNISDADAHMLDGVARILKKMLWTAWEE
jgi:DNA-binding transcriptional MerR regulator